MVGKHSGFEYAGLDVQIVSAAAEIGHPTAGLDAVRLEAHFPGGNQKSSTRAAYVQDALALGVELQTSHDAFERSPKRFDAIIVLRGEQRIFGVRISTNDQVRINAWIYVDHG